MKIYIETTVPSYLVARPARDLLQAARQQLTRDWWDLKSREHELYVSQVVLEEVGFGESEMARRRLETIQTLPLLQFTEEVAELARGILTSRILPAFAGRDAAHIALACVHQMDILLTWNCRHIANAMIERRLREKVGQWRYTLPVICTPEEMMGNNYE